MDGQNGTSEVVVVTGASAGMLKIPVVLPRRERGHPVKS